MDVGHPESILINMRTSGKVRYLQSISHNNIRTSDGHGLGRDEYHYGAYT